MEDKFRKLALKKACSSMDFFIKNADISLETNFDLIFDETDLTSEEIEIIFHEIHFIDSFEDIVNNEYRVFTKNELEKMYSDLLLYSDNID
jgi:hypothetical protein